jgi:Asp-tRNA(Asn)/Glu-tRNA(Gln) amidotransferase A subunit family amidase
MGLHDRTIEECIQAVHQKNDRIRAVMRLLDTPVLDPAAQKTGPLAGVPYVLKDCWDTAGIPTTGGSWRHRDRVPTESGPLFHALLASGAVLLGKSNLCDLAFSNESDNHILGATASPLDLERTAGGSTGGGAAAIASGMAAFDWGGDFGGSIRTPAACCGVTGLRLSQAAWPGSKEQFPLLAPFFQPMMGYGPMARTVDECRTVMRALGSLREVKGEERRDAVVIYAPDDACTGEWPTFASDAATLLLRAGVKAEMDRALPPPSAVNEIFNGYLAAHLDEFASTGELPVPEAIPAVLLALASRGKLDKRVHPNTAVLLALVQLGNLTLYRDQKRIDAEVAKLREAAKRVWARTLVVTPTATIPPPKHGRAVLAWRWQAFTKLGNLTDATCIALPFGRFASGMPRSIQVLGPPGSEESVLDLAQRIEGYS